MRVNSAVFALLTVAVHPGALTVAAEAVPTPIMGTTAIENVSIDETDMMGRRRMRMP
jgi:predicted Zn-dependent protease